MSAAAYLGLGSNLDDRLALLQGAVDGLASSRRRHGRRGVARVRDRPVGPDQPDYLNAVVAVDTELTARELLALAQSLEQAADRVRKERWGPRTLDVDVLLVGDERVDEPDLRFRTRGCTSGRSCECPWPTSHPTSRPRSPDESTRKAFARPTYAWWSRSRATGTRAGPD